MKTGKATHEMVAYLSEIEYSDLTTEIVMRTKFLFLDWLGSCLAGKVSRQVKTMESFISKMGPKWGRSEVIPMKRNTSPFFAAFVNGASSHVFELDDLYNAAVLHPGTVVFPAALATAQDLSSSGKEFITAVVAGYETAARVGEFLGRSHYKVFHTTGTAGTFGASGAVSHLLGANYDEFLNAFGSAGTQAAGLWEFLRDGADSKQLHTAKAAANGIVASYLAHEGFTGARNILEGEQGLGVGMSRDADTSRFTDGLGKKWAVLNTSLKYHASCRHTHPSLDALDSVIKRNKISPADIKTIKVHVSQAAIDVLGPITDPVNVQQSKFSMPFVLSTFVLKGNASINSFLYESLNDKRIRDLMKKVEMIYDEQIDREYPKLWRGFVEVALTDGKILTGEVKYPKGDPENFLSREEIMSKFKSLAKYSGITSEKEIKDIIDLAMNLEKLDEIGTLIEQANQSTSSR